MSKKRSKNNKYFKALMEDETIKWLKEHDKEGNYDEAKYGDQRSLEKPYLTKKKELFRDYKEIPFSNLNAYGQFHTRKFVDLDYEDE